MYFDCDNPVHAEQTGETSWASRGYIDARSADSVSATFQLPEDRICKHCGQPVTSDDEGETWTHEDTELSACDPDQLDTGVDSATATPATIAPGNWIGFTTSPEKQETRVEISVGDPRGSFTMTVRRLDDGRLILHVPHPETAEAHMRTRELHPGTYEIL